MILYRFFSIFWTILIIVPMYFIYQIVFGAFAIVNNFAYWNFMEYEPPIDEMQKKGLSMQYYGIVKVYLLIVLPIFGIFINFYNGVKNIKF